MAIKVEAELAGVVIDVPVCVGDVVPAGATLFTIESMKMEIPVTAPSAGRVRAVRVTPGQAVAGGETCVELEAVEGR